MFVPRGVDVPSLDQHKEWSWTPGTAYAVGDNVAGGDILGWTFENDLFNQHKIMVPPKSYGRIVEIMPPGNYTVGQTICVIE